MIKGTQILQINWKFGSFESEWDFVSVFLLKEQHQRLVRPVWLNYIETFTCFGRKRQSLDLPVRKCLYSYIWRSIVHQFYLSICLWRYSPLLGFGRIFSFLIFYVYTVGRTPWTGNQLVAHRAAQTQNKRTQTCVPQVGFELTVPVFEWAKTVHVLDFAATVIGVHKFYSRKSCPCTWLIKHYAMKTYGGVDVLIHVFLTSALVGDEWSASHSSRFTLLPGERSPVLNG
jgi:hypothetical protein